MIDTPKNRLPLFYAVTALFWFALYAYVPFVVPFGEDMGASLRMLGLIGGAYGFTQMLVRFPLGLVSDRLGSRKVFVLAGVLFAAAAGIVVFISPTPGALLAARALGGVAASSWVTFIVLNSAYHPPRAAAKSVGYLNAANAWGTMAALLLGGVAAQWAGVRYAFLLGGAVGLFALILGMGIREAGLRPAATRATENDPQNASTPPENTAVQPPSWASLFAVARNRFLLYTSFLAVLVQYIRFASAFGFTPLIASNLSATSMQLGMLGVAAAAPGLVISPLAGTWLPKKLGVRGTLALGFFLAAASVAAIPFVQSIFQLFVVQIIGSAGATAAFTLLMGLCIKDIEPARRATAMGFFQATYGLGMFLGPFAMGWLGAAFGLNIAFGAAAAVGMAGVFMSWSKIFKGF
jgi:MFS family permease